MGYTTDFSGSVSVVPSLNAAEIDYLNRFAGSRRMDREKGPYHAQPGNDFGQGEAADVRNYNSPPAGQPGLWCQWVTNEDGTEIEWDGGEKFYSSAEWMAYLIGHFLKPGAAAATSGDKQFAGFTFDHVVNGTIDAQGEDPDDRWRLIVDDNEVTTARGRVVFD